MFNHSDLAKKKSIKNILSMQNYFKIRFISDWPLGTYNRFLSLYYIIRYLFTNSQTFYLYSII